MTNSHSPMIGRVATVREIYLKKVWEKSGNFVDGQRNLEKTGKSGKSQGIYNKWLWQVVFRKFNNSVQEGKRCNFS